MSDTLDLLKFIGFLKTYFKPILIGSFLSACLGGYLSLKLPIEYVSSVLISLDPDSLPAISKPVEIVNIYNATISSPELGTPFFQSLIQASPDFAKHLDNQKITAGTLARRQTLTDPKAELPVRLKETRSENDFLVELTLPAKGLKEHLGLTLVKEINKLVSQYNQNIEIIKENKGQILIKNYQSIKQKNDDVHIKNLQKRQKKLSLIQEELAKIKYTLLEKTQGLEKKIDFFFKEKMNPVPQDTFIQKQSSLLSSGVQKLAEEQIEDQLHQLLGILSTTKRLSPNEAQHVRDQLEVLHEELLLNHSNTLVELLSLKTGQQRLFEALDTMSEPVARGDFYLPQFKLNLSLFEEQLTHHELEIPKDKRGIFWIMWILFGTLLTLIGCFLHWFYNHFIRSSTGLKSL